MPKKSRRKPKAAHSVEIVNTINTKFEQARAFAASEDYLTSIIYFQWVIKEINVLPPEHEAVIDPLILARAKNGLANSMYYQYDLAKALPFYKEAIAAHEQVAQTDPSPKPLYFLAIAHGNLAAASRYPNFKTKQLSTQDDENAVKHLIEATQSLEKIPESQRTRQHYLTMTDYHGELGELYQAQTNYPMAITHKLAAINAAMAEKNLDTEQLRSYFFTQLTELHMSLGALYEKVGEQALAIQSYQQGIDTFEIAREREKSELQPSHYTSVGDVTTKLFKHYEITNDAENQRKCINMGIAHALEYEARWPATDTAHIYYLGEYYQNLEKLTENIETKIEYCNKAISYFEKFVKTASVNTEGYRGLVFTNLLLGALYSSEKRYALAEKAYNTARKWHIHIPLAALTAQDLLLDDKAKLSIKSIAVIKDMQELSQDLAKLKTDINTRMDIHAPGFDPKFSPTDPYRDNTRLPASQVDPSSSLRAFIIAFGVTIAAMLITGAYRAFCRKKNRSKKPLKPVPAAKAETFAATSNNVKDVEIQSEGTLSGDSPKRYAESERFTDTSVSYVVGPAPKGHRVDRSTDETAYKKLKQRVDNLAQELFAYMREANITDEKLLPSGVAIIWDKYHRPTSFSKTPTARQIATENQELDAAETALTKAVSKGKKSTISSSTSSSSSSTGRDSKEMADVETLGSELGQRWITTELAMVRTEIMPIATKAGCNFKDIRSMRYMLAGVLARLMHKMAHCDRFHPHVRNQANHIRNALCHHFAALYTHITPENFSSPEIKAENERLCHQVLELLSYIEIVNRDISRMDPNNDLTKQFPELHLEMYKRPFPISADTKKLADRYYTDFNMLRRGADPENPMNLVAIGFTCALTGAQAMLLSETMRKPYADVIEIGREFRHAPSSDPYQKTCREACKIANIHAEPEMEGKAQAGLKAPSPHLMAITGGSTTSHAKTATPPVAGSKPSESSSTSSSSVTMVKVL